MTLLNSLLCNTRSLLMKTWWNWRPRQRTETRGRSNQTDSRHREWQDLLDLRRHYQFWGTEPKHRTVHEACSCCLECHPGPLCHDDEKKKSFYPDITGSFFKESRQSWIQQRTGTCVINVRREWNCSLPSVSYCRRSFSSAVFHLLSLRHSVTLLACSLDASLYVPAVVLYSCTSQGTLLYVKNVFFCVIFIYYLCRKYYKPVTVQLSPFSGTELLKPLDFPKW